MELNHLNFQSRQTRYMFWYLAVLGIEPRLKRVSMKFLREENHNVTCYHYWKDC